MAKPKPQRSRSNRLMAACFALAACQYRSLGFAVDFRPALGCQSALTRPLPRPLSRPLTQRQVLTWKGENFISINVDDARFVEFFFIVAVFVWGWFYAWDGIQKANNEDSEEGEDVELLYEDDSEDEDEDLYEDEDDLKVEEKPAKKAPEKVKAS
mmetsp:Transcript_51137/g.91878  ORF Transcript_51137/g.91878 Transcript_51137/m.91878 type:complete len:155 (+) Transcript_51137:59-523(+)|eukprot:CAMPEP_0197656074 /NCGR_PEP_ID=MMETSP1338-20131121/40103_1 /TAXON_ID=43686 ORGANISM="Pelagodinium beii, Strain RCC1491" /NCGR_SAMPLE_ID=MMETSP1338 /ASSEMBLY_ACC=CAM_ASM_000754 /LENGTH=154 /DNA_ID=CAMNT_0043231881 /DNA_START=49 /DNA_END=513 /DNA_ORIENTATION=-